MKARDPQTHAIIGAAMEVHRQMGHRFSEGVYQEALALEFAERDIVFRREAALKIRCKGRVLRCEYVADFLCFDAVVVEPKAVGALVSEHRARVINELKATGYRVGLPMNFGAPSLEYLRFVGAEQPADLSTDYADLHRSGEEARGDRIESFTSDDAPPALLLICVNLRNLWTNSSCLNRARTLLLIAAGHRLAAHDLQHPSVFLLVPAAGGGVVPVGVAGVRPWVCVGSGAAFFVFFSLGLPGGVFGAARAWGCSSGKRSSAVLPRRFALVLGRGGGQLGRAGGFQILELPDRHPHRTLRRRQPSAVAGRVPAAGHLVFLPSSSSITRWIATRAASSAHLSEYLAFIIFFPTMVAGRSSASRIRAVPAPAEPGLGHRLEPRRHAHPRRPRQEVRSGRSAHERDRPPQRRRHRPRLGPRRAAGRGCSRMDGKSTSTSRRTRTSPSARGGFSD